MYMLFTLLLNILFFAANPITPHDFHVSKLDIHYNQKTAQLECTLHVFLNDLEQAINLSGSTNIGTEIERAKSDELIEEYLIKKIKIFVDNKSVTLHFLGKEEAERDVAGYFYFEVKDVGSLHEIKVENLLFHEIFEDQKNIISITSQDQLIGFTILDKKNISTTISL